MPVLGTVAHFLPTLSMMNPAGRIMLKTNRPMMLKSEPTSLGVKPRRELA